MTASLPVVDVDFTAQPAIPPAGIARANELMASGRLFRYGEAGAEELDVAELEREFAASIGRAYCVATNSCGASIAVALRAAGVAPGDDVLMNAFTLAPVPGAVAHVQANAVFVEIDNDYRIDLDSLRQAHASTGAKWLLLSYMRGHIPDMVQLTAVCDELGITVIEDCAHTMGASWNGKPTGTFGAVGCFSTQTFKHINSGEGGLLVTDDADIAAQAVLLSGSYMLYGQHGAIPDDDVFQRHRMTTPNWSMRMSALAAAVVRPQLPLLADRAATWRSHYKTMAAGLDGHPRIRLPHRPAEEGFVPSSFQFSLVDVTTDEIERWLELTARHGVFIKWFGRAEPLGFTSRFDHWRYASEQTLLRTQEVLRGLCDIRLPLGLTTDQCADIASVIGGALDIVLADPISSAATQ